MVLSSAISSTNRRYRLLRAATDAEMPPPPTFHHPSFKTNSYDFCFPSTSKLSSLAIDSKSCGAGDIDVEEDIIDMGASRLANVYDRNRFSFRRDLSMLNVFTPSTSMLFAQHRLQARRHSKSSFLRTAQRLRSIRMRGVSATSEAFVPPPLSPSPSSTCSSCGGELHDGLAEGTDEEEEVDEEDKEEEEGDDGAKEEEKEEEEAVASELYQVGRA